jgi:hypothetical protein
MSWTSVKHRQSSTTQTSAPVVERFLYGGAGTRCSPPAEPVCHRPPCRRPHSWHIAPTLRRQGAYSHRALCIFVQHYLSVLHSPAPNEQGRLQRYCALCNADNKRHEHLVADWAGCFILLSLSGKQWTLTHWENLNEWLFYDP